MSTFSKPEWDRCAATVEAGLNDLLFNKFKEAQARFEAALTAEETSAKPDPSILSFLRLGLACVSLSESLSAGALDGLGQLLPVLWKAEAEAAQGEAWVGVQLCRGVTLMFGGLIQILQQSYIKGGLNISKAWSIIKPASAEGIKYTGPHQPLVRSLSEFLIGSLNLFVSLLPPAIMSVVEMVGFDGRRDIALKHLERAWKSEGIFSGFSSLMLLNFYTYVRPFFFEKLSIPETKKIHQILDWGSEKFPGSVFFGISEGNFNAVQKEPLKAISSFSKIVNSAESIPTLQMLILYRRGLSHISNLEFSSAAKDFRLAADSQLKAERQSYLLILSLLEILCLRIHDPNTDVTEIVTRMNCTKSKFNATPEAWMPTDRWSIRKIQEYINLGFTPKNEKKIPKNEINGTKAIHGSHPAYLLDLLYGPILCFAATAEKFPGPQRRKLFNLLDSQTDDDFIDACKRNILKAEFSRQEGKRSMALDFLDLVLDSEQEEISRNFHDPSLLKLVSPEIKDAAKLFSSIKFKRDLASEAGILLALLWQGLIFAEAGEREAAEESLSELDENKRGNLSSWVTGEVTEYDAVIKFRRVGIDRMLTLKNTSEDSFSSGTDK